MMELCVEVIPIKRIPNVNKEKNVARRAFA